MNHSSQSNVPHESHKQLSLLTLAQYIDHTLLKPEAKITDIEMLCAEAVTWRFASVCIQPMYVIQALDYLQDSKISVCTVIGFPLGANSTAVKLFEAENALKNGAQELDVVLSIGALKNKDYSYVLNEIAAVTFAAHSHSALVKVIIETALLSDEEKIAACGIVNDSGADFIKTSTGFSSSGAVARDVELLRKYSASHVKVKASGGIRTKEIFDQMIHAGAERIGTSSGVRILQEYAEVS